jgi:methyl-accepting chemotaxis protein
MIRRKLVLAFALELALVAGVAATGLVGLNSVRGSFRSAIDRGLEVQRLAGEMKSELALARRAEKDFLLHWQSDGVDPALKFVAENHHHLGRLREALADLGHLEQAGVVTYPPKRTVENIIALEPYINVYAEDFEAAVELVKQQAQLSPPLEQSFREMVAQILVRLREQSALLSVTANLVDLRQAERDYLWRGRRAAAAEVRRSADRLGNQLRQLPATGPRSQVLLQRYQAAFEAVATAASRLAAKTDDFNAAAVVVEPLVDDIASVGQREAAAEVAAAQLASGRTVLFVTLIVVVAMLVGASLATVLGHQITSPLTQLAQTAKAIGGGDLSARAHVEARDELGMLATTFNTMTDKVRQLVGSLEERVQERERAEGEVRRLNSELEERVRTRTGELQTANEELEAFSVLGLARPAHAAAAHGGVPVPDGPEGRSEGGGPRPPGGDPGRGEADVEPDRRAPGLLPGGPRRHPPHAHRSQAPGGRGPGRAGRGDPLAQDLLAPGPPAGGRGATGCSCSR